MEAITGLLLYELEERLQPLGMEPYRAKQIMLWVHRRRAVTFDEMTDLSKEQRETLKQHFVITGLTVKEHQQSADETEKFLLGLSDGENIETVLIRDGDRKTVCVSTQVGCPIRCVFCASGLNGLKRNLTTEEIVEQVLHIQRRLPADDRINNLVIMGMGEPLLNLQNLVRAFKIFRSSWGMGIGYNRMTLSTAGLLDRLPTLIEQKVTPNLAVSLHASNDAMRKDVVPTLKQTVSELIKGGVEYKQATGKDVTFEYVLMEGVNDSPENARELGRKLGGLRCKVNIIPYNPVQGLPYREPSTDTVDRFATALGQCGVPITVRKRKGSDIDAACGQLRGRFEEKKVALNADIQS